MRVFVGKPGSLHRVDARTCAGSEAINEGLAMLRMRIASVHVPDAAVAQLEAFGDVAELAKEAHRLRAQRAERVVFALDQFRPATYEDGLLTAERTTVSMADEQHRQHTPRTVPSSTKRSGFPVGHGIAQASREGDVVRLLLSGRQSRFTAFART
jgi:hypothetical protein